MADREGIPIHVGGAASLLAAVTSALCCSPVEPTAPAEPTIVVADLGTLDGGEGAVRPVDINGRGQVVGNVFTRANSRNFERAFLWENGAMRDLGTPGPDYASSRAVALNDLGQVIGESVKLEGDDQSQRCFLWENGVMQDLGELDCSAINNRGQIVGRVNTPSGTRGFIWESGVVRDVVGRSASAINDAGQVVGNGWSPDCATPPACAARAFLWENGTARDLGALEGGTTGARDINEHGQVVGSSTINASGQTHTFLWDNGAMQDLGTLGGLFNESGAVAINNRGQVLGVSWVEEPERVDEGGRALPGRRTSVHAFLWDDGVMHDLGTVADSLPFSLAVAINGCGQVLGNSIAALYRRSAVPERAFVWQDGMLSALPVPTPGLTSSVVAVNDGGQAVGTVDSYQRGVMWTLPPCPTP
jgi:probable HAF family extracellular repeat protein